MLVYLIDTQKSKICKTFIFRICKSSYSQFQFDSKWKVGWGWTAQLVSSHCPFVYPALPSSMAQQVTKIDGI